MEGIFNHVSRNWDFEASRMSIFLDFTLCEELRRKTQIFFSWDFEAIMWKHCSPLECFSDRFLIPSQVFCAIPRGFSISQRIWCFLCSRKRTKNAFCQLASNVVKSGVWRKQPIFSHNTHTFSPGAHNFPSWSTVYYQLLIITCSWNTSISKFGHFTNYTVKR